MNHVKFLFLFQFFMTLLACAMTFWYLQYSPLLSPDDASFFNTILATVYSLTIAIFVYWQQQKQKYESLKSSMLNYLDYLKEYFENDSLPDKHFDDIGKQNLPMFNKSIVINLINSGYFPKDTAVLIEFQNYLDFHYQLIDKYLERDDFEGLEHRFKNLKGYMLGLIDRLQKVLK